MAAEIDGATTRLAGSLVELLEEPFATPEDVGLDVRRVEVAGADPTRVEVDLADGTRFCLRIERLA